MRVCIINLNLVGADAIGQCILNQVRYFERRGDTVRVYVMHPPQGIPDNIAALTRVVTLSDVATQRDEYFSRSDLYVYHYPGHYPLVDSMHNLERGAVIFYYHNVTPPNLWGSDFERDRLVHSLASVSSVSAYADLSVTVSEFNADQLVRDHGVERDHIRVLPLAVQLDRFAPGPKDDALLRRYQLHGRRIVLFVGRMAGNKRIDLLVEALPIVRRTVPNAVLLLIGDDRGNPALQETVAKARARASELGITPHVIFTGPVDDQTLYYRLADVYASASLHEGFGVPLIEAMASGVPVVASNATAHPWVLGEAGLLVEPDNAVDLANQIVRVLTDDALCGDLVQRGLDRAKEFSLERYEAGWGKIVAEATEWLPQHPYPRLRPLTAPTSGRTITLSTPSVSASFDELKWLGNAADVMQRGYVVRSNAPLVGSLIAWVRRNLTSHLREPYLDPTLERQVAFNREVVQTLRRTLDRLADNTAAAQARPPELAQQLSQIEAQLAELQQQADALRQNLSQKG